jgi:subtilisin-like proprotein convertase family protein
MEDQQMRPRVARSALGASLLALLTLSLGGTAGAAVTFSSSTPTVITAPSDSSFTCYFGQHLPAQVTTGSPYPSQIPVSGLGGDIQDVNVTLSLFTYHGGDVEVLLVGPTGASVVLTADNGYDYAANVVLTFDDQASATLPGSFTPLISGTYKPSPNGPSGNGCEHPTSLPAPAPSAPYGSTLSVLNGTDPNGTWSLYAISDTFNGTTSTIPSWSLDITAANSYTVSSFSQPVENLPDQNAANAGSTIPLKFTVTDASGSRVTNLTTSDVSVTSTLGGDGCGTTGDTDAIETYVGGSGLQNLGNGVYQYNWKTVKAYKGQCRTTTLSIVGATGSESAGFIFR